MLQIAKNIYNSYVQEKISFLLCSIEIVLSTLDIAVLYIPTAGNNFIDFKTKRDLKSLQNQAIKQIQAISDNLKTWSLISLRSFYLLLALTDGDVLTL